ncbi:MAG: hypothetical protein AB7F98_11105 [Novosphingobium sp.]
MKRAMILAILVFIGLGAFLLWPGQAHAAPNCGMEGGRPCTIFERVPSCDPGLYEDFGKGKCLRLASSAPPPPPPKPGPQPSSSQLNCGKENHKPCTIWERVPSCDRGLVEDFSKGLCVRPAAPPPAPRPQQVNCGKEGSNPCPVWIRVPSCDAGLVEDFARGKCVRNAPPPPPQQVNCGKEGGSPCPVWVRVPSCDAGLIEDFARGKCLRPAPPPPPQQVNCGSEGGAPCPVWVRVPSCNPGLVEDFAQGKCLRPAPPRPLDCGKDGQRPCKIWERVPSCDPGLAEDFAKGRCVVDRNAALLQKGALYILAAAEQLDAANNLRECMQQPSVMRVFRVAVENRNRNEAFDVGLPCIQRNLEKLRRPFRGPDGNNYKFVTLMVGVDVNASLIVGAEGGMGLALDLYGNEPPHFYTTDGISAGIQGGIGATAVVSLSYEPLQAGTDLGLSVGVDVKAVEGASASLDMDRNFRIQGLTVGGGTGISVDFGTIHNTRTMVW